MSKRRPHGTGSLSQRADGIWVGRIEAGWTPSGTRRRLTVSSKSKAEAARKLKEMQRRIAAEGMPAVASARVTVKAWSETWLPIHATKVRPTTFVTDRGTIGKWIVPTIGHRRLTDLTPADLRAVRDAITGAGRSTTTALHAHKVLHKMLRDARAEGHEVPQRVMDAEKPRKAANDRTRIPADQAARLMRVIASRPDGPRWVASLIQGMRQGEALGLTWDRVDLAGGYIDVRWQLQWLADGHTTPDGWEAHHLTGTAWLTRPKTAAGQRQVPLVDWMHATLLAYRDRWTPNPWGLLWVDEDGQPIRDDADRATWREIQEEARALHPSGRPWHGHEMRHTMMSMLAAKGVDRSAIEALVGQAKIVDSYLHSTKEEGRRALNGIAGDLLDGAQVPALGQAPHA